MTKIVKLHPNAPTRLIAAVSKAGSERSFAKGCGVDHHYVSQLIHLGIEPTDTTERGQVIRVLLFLPRRKRKQREVKPEEWQGQKRVVKLIRRLHRDTTRTFKKSFSD